MKGKTKKSIIVLVVLLAIGFAAVTTTLTINGTIHLGANEDNFKNNLLFTRAALDYSDTTKTDLEVNTATDATAKPNVADKLEILESGKKIKFSTETLTNIDETATLTYDIKNNSQYGAQFEGIQCTVKDETGKDVTSEIGDATKQYIKLETDNVDELIGSKDKSNNTITGKTLKVTMIRSYVGTAATEADGETPAQPAKNSTSYEIECEIKASGVSETN